ncbi:MAG TPA: hypothetical protein ENK57_12865, partial [Polyangiaceae bacterium]|nr:hypothetical protein [Polyangiaceae bacterium]
MPSYPEAPWQTHGQAWFRPYLVDASTVTPPPGLEVLSRAGRCIGLLGYVSYEAPSPLVYQELLWMPARVRARTVSGQAVG